MPQRPREDQVPHVLWARHELLSLSNSDHSSKLHPVPTGATNTRKRAVSVGAVRMLLCYPMLFSALFLACGSSPIVTVSAATFEDVPMPGALQAAIDTEIGRSIQICYETVLKTHAGLSGRVEFDVVGSHGILHPKEIGDAHQGLSTCVLEALGDSRLQRKLGDGPNKIGFELTVNFTP